MRGFLRKLLRPKPQTEADVVIDTAFEAGKALRAKTARECAEMVMGRPLTDEEWGKVADKWTARWY